MTSGPTLILADYLVMSAMLLVPLAIGIFYAWKDADKQNKVEYLLGGKRMMTIPVALSIFITYQSAVSFIGFPSDVYRFGPMIILGMSISYVIGYFTMVPLLYPLRLTSIYEYLERRYKSRAIRLLCTVIGMLQSCVFVAMTLVAPALALQAVVSLPMWISMLIVGGLGTVYTALGGIKSVVWTDVFQTGLVFFGGLALIVKGTMAVGSPGKVWSIAQDGGRTDFNHFRPDPRLRHTWWGMLIGICCAWLTNVFTQSIGQRLTALRSITAAKKAYLLNVPLHIVYGTMLTLIGLVIYAYFDQIRCDPLQGGLISNPNQAAPYFMLRVFQDLPGMAGLYMASIFSGTLSTVSSGINALAANTLEEILGGRLRGVSDKKVTLLAKVIVCIFGFAIIGLAYLLMFAKGSLPQLSITALSACGSAILGMFFLGCTVPWANKFGAFCGGLSANLLVLWMVIGNRMYGKKAIPLPPAPTDGCPAVRANSSLTNATFEFDMNFQRDVTPSYIWSNNMSSLPTPTGSQSDDYGFFFYNISYEWYALMGFLMCIVLGLIVSLLTASRVEGKVDSQLILPYLRRFWANRQQLSTAPEGEESKVRELLILQGRPRVDP